MINLVLSYVLSLDQHILIAQPTTPQYIEQDYSPILVDPYFPRTILIPEELPQRMDERPPLEIDFYRRRPPHEMSREERLQQQQREAWYGSKTSYNQAIEYNREEQRRLFQDAYPTSSSQEEQRNALGGHRPGLIFR